MSGLPTHSTEQQQARGRVAGWFAARRADTCALAVIILFFAAFFGPTLCAGRFLIAGDAYYQSYPLRTVAWAMIKRGELPLWTPFIFSGYPLLSMAQTAVGYPLTWGYLFLPARFAEQIVVLAPWLVAPLFMYGFVRETGRTRLAALLAALAFAYGGGLSSKMGGLGLMANPVSWLPAFLWAIERTRRDGFVRGLLWATAAYTMSVLAGQGNGFTLVARLAFIYALYLTLFPSVANVRASDGVRRAWAWPRLRPLAVVVGAGLLTIGVAAFQVLESLRAVRRSIRSTLSYEAFSYGAFTPAEAVKSLVAPLYHYIEVTAYITPLAVVLAVIAVVQAVRVRRERRAICFWAALAVVTWVMMLGDSTPLYRLFFRIPVFNLFRYPSRHTFEWTFAMSMLAAYGWDALPALYARGPSAEPRAQTRAKLVCWLLCAAAALVAVLWILDATVRPRASNFGLESGLIPALPEQRYLLWKLTFTALVLLLIWRALKLVATRSRTALLVGAIALACYVEPYIFLAHVWFPYAKTTDRFTAVPPVEQWLQQYPPEQHRIYTRVNLFVRGYWTPPALDLPNMTAPRGLHNVAAYEQLIFSRYSRALGDVGPDTVNPPTGITGTPDETLLARRSHVLDLLNTSFLVTFPHLATAPESVLLHDGVGFAAHDLARSLQPGETTTLAGEAATGDTLLLVTSLSNSTDVGEAETVARLRLSTTDGRSSEHELRAGRDTAEWAHERADERAVVKQQLAPVFDRVPGDAANSFAAQRYLARIPLGARLSLARIEITNAAAHATLALWKASLYDAAHGQSVTLADLPASLDAERWAAVFNQDGVVVWQNGRACPRAWLVAEAEAVDGETALRRIRGDDGRAFDPRRTALLEVRPEELPALPGGALAATAHARIVEYSPNRLVVESDAPTPTVLLLSEIFYPGWVATVDGRPARVDLADFLLRGVALSAGAHRIEMRYTAPAARTGALISALTLALLAGLFVYTRRVRPTSGARVS